MVKHKGETGKIPKDRFRKERLCMTETPNTYESKSSMILYEGGISPFSSQIWSSFGKKKDPKIFGFRNSNRKR